MDMQAFLAKLTERQIESLFIEGKVWVRGNLTRLYFNSELLIKTLYDIEDYQEHEGEYVYFSSNKNIIKKDFIDDELEKIKEDKFFIDLVSKKIGFLPESKKDMFLIVLEKLANNRKTVREQQQVKCDCGCTVSKILRMSASRGSSCPDCYDRMSD